MRQRVYVAVVFVPILFVVLFYLPPEALLAVLAAVCAVAAYELISATGIKNNQRIGIYVTFSAAIIPIGVYLNYGASVFRAVILVLMCVLFIEAVNAFKTLRKITFAQILVALFGGTVIPYMLSSLLSLRQMPQGHLLVLIPIICAFVTDGGAYFTGVLFGKRRAFPHVSPKKTVEGCIGGIVTGVAAMAIYGVVIFLTTMHDVHFHALMIYGIVGGAVTILGDLAFSLIKREYNIKDYGKLLPGHGGMLDRFDSMVFCAPAIYLLVTVMPAIIVR